MQYLKVGDKVKLTRRPFFSGVIKAVQQEFFSDWGGAILVPMVLQIRQ